MDNMGASGQQNHHVGRLVEDATSKAEFMISATYDTLPSPLDLYLWYSTEKTCQLCSSSNPS